MSVSPTLQKIISKSPTLELIRSPKYVGDRDIPLSYVDWRLLVTLSEIHYNNCLVMCNAEYLKDVDNALTRILVSYNRRMWAGQEIFSTSFDHSGGMWGYPETDGIEVKYIDRTTGKYLLERNTNKFLASGRLKNIPLAIHERLQLEL